LFFVFCVCMTKICKMLQVQQNVSVIMNSGLERVEVSKKNLELSHAYGKMHVARSYSSKYS
jgi:hypothetical protein